MNRVRYAVLTAFAVLLAAAPAPGLQDTGGVRISGWALSFGTIGTGKNETIDITVTRWSPIALRDQLLKTMLEKKQQGLLDELQRQPEIGRWRFPGYMGPDPNNIYRLGTPIRYAMNHPGEDGGRRIVLLTERIMGFQEIRNQPRTVDYPFTLMELRFKKDGTGEGRMLWYTQFDFDKKRNQLEIENYSSEPVRLNQLKLEPYKR
jgi:hypothetical protein